MQFRDEPLSIRQTTCTDEELMVRYGQGDHQAFETLYARHKDSLYRYFCRQLSDMNLAQDLYQELWSRVIKSSVQYEAHAKWTTWAYRIAHNLVIDHIRVLKPSEQWNEEDHSKESNLRGNAFLSPDKESEHGEMAERLKVCISQLPQAQQEVFLLNEETGMTLKAIADVVSVSVEAAKSRLRYARSQLQDCLKLYRGSFSTTEGDK